VQNQTWEFLANKPVLFRRGLFADLDSGISEVLILYMPVREEQMVALPEYAVEGAPE
jgi:hypothetical protein